MQQSVLFQFLSQMLTCYLMGKQWIKSTKRITTANRWRNYYDGISIFYQRFDVYEWKGKSKAPLKLSIKLDFFLSLNLFLKHLLVLSQAPLQIPINPPKILTHLTPVGAQNKTQSVSDPKLVIWLKCFPISPSIPMIYGHQSSPWWAGSDSKW